MVGKLLKSLKKDNLESISGMDAAFLYAETPTSPMHIGSAAIIEGDLSYEKFRARIAARIHMLPKLRKRLLYVPMSIDYPYWVDDPNFDLDMHLDHIALPRPGGWKELRKVASRIFSEPLDQNRPLWSFTFVEGVDEIAQVPEGSVAIISKIHHVAIDGMAGAGILGLLFDFTPTPPDDPAPESFYPKPLPNELSVIMQSTLSFAEDPLKFPRLLTQTVTSSLKAGVFTRVQQAELPTAPFSAPSTPWNRLISAHRKWNAVILSLDRVKAIKKIMGTTLNDVILAFCASALRRYLIEKGKLPVKPLVAHVPISVQSSEQQESGNNISGMLVQLATNIEDPIERLEVIHENTMRGKTYQNAVGARTLSNMAEMVPFGLANQAARIYSRFHLAELHNPVFNVTITNVPGPQFPLYLAGHKLHDIMGMAPIIDGMGLIITVFSYNGNITVSATTDVKSMPDVDKFTRYIREAANELEELVLQKGIEKTKAVQIQTDTTAFDDMFIRMAEFLAQHKEKAAAVGGSYQFEITGDASTNWILDLEQTPAKVEQGTIEAATVTFSMKDIHFQQFVDGKLDLQTAFVQGRLKLNGDIGKALELGKLLNEMLAVTVEVE